MGNGDTASSSMEWKHCVRSNEWIPTRQMMCENKIWKRELVIAPIDRFVNISELAMYSLGERVLWFVLCDNDGGEGRDMSDFPLS